MTDLQTLKEASREAELAKRKAETARQYAWEAFRVYVSPQDSPAAAAANEAWRAAVTSVKLATAVTSNTAKQYAADVAEEAWRVARAAEWEAWHVLENAWAVERQTRSKLQAM